MKAFLCLLVVSALHGNTRSQNLKSEDPFCSTLNAIVMSGEDGFGQIQGDSVDYDIGYPYEINDRDRAAWKTRIQLPGAVNSYIQHYSGESYFECTLSMDTTAFNDQFYQMFFAKADSIQACLGDSWTVKQNLPNIHIADIRELTFTSPNSSVSVVYTNATRYHDAYYYVILLKMFVKK